MTDRVHVVAAAEPPCRRCRAPLRGPAFGSYARRRGGLAAHRPVRRRARGADRGARGGDPVRRRALRRVAADRVPARPRSTSGCSQQALRRVAPRGSRTRSASSPSWCSAERGPDVGARLAGPGRHAGRRPDAPLGAVRARPRRCRTTRCRIVRGRGIDTRRAALPRRAARPGATSCSSTAGPARARSPASSPPRSSANADRHRVRAASSRCSPTRARASTLYGTREDFLIPSACLNSTVSGLVSRTVLNDRILRARAVPRREVLPRARAAPTSRRSSSTRSPRGSPTSRRDVARDWPALRDSDRTPTWAGWAEVERISARVRHRRRQPGQARRRRDHPGAAAPGAVAGARPSRTPRAELAHVRLLAEQRGVPVEEVPDLAYSCVGLIHPLHPARPARRASAVTSSRRDLDRTLIYSRAARELGADDARRPGLRRGARRQAGVVHDRGGRRRSSPSCADARGRGPGDHPHRSSSTAGCGCPGRRRATRSPPTAGVLLVDGAVDRDWTRRVARELAGVASRSTRCGRTSAQVCHPECTDKLRNASRPVLLRGRATGTRCRTASSTS